MRYLLSLLLFVSVTFSQGVNDKNFKEKVNGGVVVAVFCSEATGVLRLASAKPAREAMIYGGRASSSGRSVWKMSVESDSGLRQVTRHSRACRQQKRLREQGGISARQLGR